MLRINRVRPFLITIILFFLLIVPLSISADEDDIEKLQEKITELEKRIKQLEGALSQYQVYAEDSADQEKGWWSKKNWRSLKKGMRSSEVKDILGEPIKTIKGSRTLWYYPNIYCGYVTFDEKGRLEDWNEP